MKCSLLTLSTFLDEELDARKRGEVEAHLVACDRCSRGITHLREESDRVSQLAPVHVADHSAHALMEQVGIIDSGITVPMKTNASVTIIPDDTPPWLAGGSGKALPWKPQRAVPPTVPAPATPSEVRSAPAAQDEGDSSDGSSPSTWNDTSDRYVVDEPTEPVNWDLEDEAPPKPIAQPWFPPGTTAESLTADPRLPLTSGTQQKRTPSIPPPPLPPPAASVTPPPAKPPEKAEPEITPDATVVPVPTSIEDWPEPQAQTEIPVVSKFPAPIEIPATPEVSAPPEIPVVSKIPAPIQIPVQAEIPEAAETPFSFEPGPPAPWDEEGSIHDLHEAYELDAAKANSVPALPPVRAPKQNGLIARVRDALAVRRAVRSLPDDDSVEVFNGDRTPVAQPQLPRRAGPVHDEVEQERRLQAAAAAAAPEGTESFRDQLEIEPVTFEPDPEPAPLPAPVIPAPVAAAPVPAVPAVPVEAPEDPFVRRLPTYEDETSLHDLREQALNPPALSSGPPSAPNRLRAKSLQSRIPSFDKTRIPSFDKRLLAVAAVAVLVVIIGIATGKTSKVSPTTASHSPATAGATTSTHPTSSGSAPATATATPPTGTATALTNTKTAGDGGTGYAIEDVRYGQHPGDFRIVFDMSGGTGLPNVVVGFKSPTVMDVVITGATPSNATGVLPNTTTVKSVAILPRTTSGQTVYEYTLARPVTVSKPGYAVSPTRLILDLA